MGSIYKQIKNGNTQVHFSRALFGEVESSTMTARPYHLTTFNAGRLVPIYCREILPDETIEMRITDVIRQTTVLTPTMGSMVADFYAFFVPNRIVNKSWKQVQGENESGSWVAPSVTLAPLLSTSYNSPIQIPVGSVADYYGFPTQKPIPASVLQSCNDLKFRGYVSIWNEYFRDQNYQPPYPISYLNVYQGFLQPNLTTSGIPLSGDSSNLTNIGPGVSNGDGAFGANAIHAEVYGSGFPTGSFSVANVNIPSNGYKFFAVNEPLKVNKFHDYFTSVSPSPQKGLSVLTPVSGVGNFGPIPVTTTGQSISGSHPVLRFLRTNGTAPTDNADISIGGTSGGLNERSVLASGSDVFGLYPCNLSTIGGSMASVNGLEFSISDLRMSAAIQQYYEILARGGSRYRELLSSFFGLSVDDPFSDIPQRLGHISKELDLYQTAQTSASESNNTPQGNLAAFGYTTQDDEFLFKHRFIEHGYLHVFVVVRHRNVYSSFLSKDNFRLSALDFYQPPLANISEQPVFTKEINPFVSDSSQVFGYQEAWADYRYEPDYVSGYMRPGLEGSLSLWNYADNFDSSLVIANGDWLRSNSSEVLDRTLAVTSLVSPQFKGQFMFTITKTLPMPTYSVPGLDII